MTMRSITTLASARLRLAVGVKKLEEAVGSTLGPHGRNVTVWLGHGVPMTTKDGAAVAREVQLPDMGEAAGAELAKAAARKTAEEAGDGTTTSTILVNALVQEGLDAMAEGMSLREVREEFEDGLTVAETILNSMKKDVVDVGTLVHVATISANSSSVGEKVGRALFEVGKDGLATVELGLEPGITVEKTEGYRFDKGWISPAFVSDASRLRTTLEDAAIYLTPDTLTTGEQVVTVLAAAAEAKKKALLMVVGGIEGQALATAILNRKEGRMDILVVKAPGYGERREELLGDVACLTGGVIHTLEDGDKTGDFLGFAAKVEADRMGTVIFGGSGTKEAKAERLESIATLRKGTKSQFDRSELDKRAQSLDGRAVAFSVGGRSETEALELFHRVEDAILASKSALQGGILPGGGRALLEVHREVFAAYPTFAMALVAPFWRLLMNAEPKDFHLFTLDQAFTDNVWEGLAWQGRTREFTRVDLYEAGIMDPYLVTLSALKNAVSAACLILSTGTVITEEKEGLQNG